MHDLVIRGGTIVDGSGGEPYQADLAIAGERIVEIGANLARGVEEIDAEGLIVTPGFIDPHTHYDGQMTWDPILAPSSWHGVTTLIAGNCGVGFAPVRPSGQSWLIEIMEAVEEIPREVLSAGLRWDWESFPSFLEALEARQHTVDVGVLFPHVALREYVMGDRARTDELARPDDIAEMTRLVEEGLKAGALGFTCSRTDVHRLPDGRLVPASLADRDELLALCDGVVRAGSPPVQFLGFVSDAERCGENFSLMSDMAKRSGSTVHFLMFDKELEPGLRAIEDAAEAGVELVGHIPPRAIGNILHWRAARHPFMGRPSIKALASLPWPERVRHLEDPAFKAKVLAEPNEGEELLAGIAKAVFTRFDLMFEVDDTPDYEPDPERDSIAVRACAQGVDPACYAYDIMTRNSGEGMMYMAFLNYRSGNLDEMEPLIRHERTMVSLGDGGAHCSRVVDSSTPTFMLTHWARDRTRGATLPLAFVIKRCTRDPALAYGLADRGLLAPGYLADINVIDFDQLRLRAPYISADLPSGGERLLQSAEGYRFTIKRGQVTFRDGVHMGKFLGQLVRGAQPIPA